MSERHFGLLAACLRRHLYFIFHFRPHPCLLLFQLTPLIFRPLSPLPIAVARTEDYLEGDVIIHKGDMGSTFYVILEGVVLITEASLGDGDDDVGASGDSMSPGGV